MSSQCEMTAVSSYSLPAWVRENSRTFRIGGVTRNPSDRASRSWSVRIPRRLPALALLARNLGWPLKPTTPKSLLASGVHSSNHQLQRGPRRTRDSSQFTAAVAHIPCVPRTYLPQRWRRLCIRVPVAAELAATSLACLNPPIFPKVVRLKDLTSKATADTISRIRDFFFRCNRLNQGTHLDLGHQMGDSPITVVASAPAPKSPHATSNPVHIFAVRGPP